MAAAQRWPRAPLAWFALCGALLVTGPAHAHLMAAQKGSLNLVNDVAFLVLSVPVSALKGVDDDGDGALSRAELSVHVDTIRAQVQAGVQLHDAAGALPLQLVMLDVAPPDNTPKAAAKHLVVMGRFQLTPLKAQSKPSTQAGAEHLSFTFTLFGTKPGELAQDVTITRQEKTQWLRFVPARVTQNLLPSAASMLGEYIVVGVTHVLSGMDHMLFLLVILTTGWRLRSIILALTCFTAGHAITLIACAWLGLAVPSIFVEPAIAATILGMALFDRWSQRNAVQQSQFIRLSLVFICALIHGLGLAGALTDLGLDQNGKAQSLVGFNIGVEAAQLLVAVMTFAIVKAIEALKGNEGLAIAFRFVSNASLAISSFWFIERVASAA